MESGLIIAIEDPGRADNTALLETHLAHMHAISEPCTVHALDVAALQGRDVTFWSARHDTDQPPVGCMALKELDATHGEIKSMHVVQTARRTGLSHQLMAVLLTEARTRGYKRLSLETGSTDHFVPARSLYAKHGFKECGPFAHYEPHPHSAFMTLEL